MQANKRYKLFLISMVFALLSIMCSSSYVTPDSLTATAQATFQQTDIPTAFFVFPTETVTVSPTVTETPDPLLFSPTPDLPSATPEPTATTTPEGNLVESPPLQYTVQSGDTWEALAIRFGVAEEEIISDEPIAEEGFLNPGQFMLIPNRLSATSPEFLLIPDSAFIFSSTATDFDVVTYVNTMGGFLSKHREFLGADGWMTGAEIVEKVARDNSINPRLLLALLEYQSGWVFGNPATLSATKYPMGYIDNDAQKLNSQLLWAANRLMDGYYGWRSGEIVTLDFKGMQVRIAPNLNAGSAGLQHYFSQIYEGARWFQAVEPNNGFMLQYAIMFGDPWGEDLLAAPLIPGGLNQPELILPFLLEQIWSYTGGPHGAWSPQGVRAAIDFAPAQSESGCTSTEKWAVAAAPGVVARVGTGLVILDLDGDGNEQTGWVLMYLHVRRLDNIEPGIWLDKSAIIGQPSCDGGSSSGTHIHIARKYNGEWITAEGPISFVLSGWQAIEGENAYEGALVRGNQTIEACTCGKFSTQINRSKNDP